MDDFLNREACYGFSGPEDRVVSLNVPLTKEDRKNGPYQSFDIEYNLEQPQTLTIRLLELDQDGFIRTALQSISFRVDVLANLVNRRTATDEEAAAWKSMADDD